ncbi:HEPN domain-containing protein [Acetobacter indonesiensis]|uniref:HEPN domain-containing protein n=1 Tax=Acetobacter indonesiensis TaxID=104101 RepID=UPI0020A55019|nr:HEPN domain-containing protein [Acetobacter indonesiensis]
MDHIFEARKQKIGERVRQALGWLARGRQSSDRADRFLHFFTAIEALLSSDDRNTPIIQNIARNAASILDDTPVGRENIAKTLKDLYSTRSKLVHTGSRNIGDDQVSELENIAHILCWHIIDRTDLSITVQEFQESLQKSSYGLPWKEEEKGRIPV